MTALSGPALFGQRQLPLTTSTKDKLKVVSRNRRVFFFKMYPAPCSPSSSIFSEMLELHAARNSSKRDYSEEEQLSIGSSYDAAKSSPVFLGRYGHKLSDSVAEIREGEDGMSTRSSLYPEFDPAINHPATFGYVLLDRKPAPPKQESPPLPDPKECELILYNVTDVITVVHFHDKLVHFHE